MPKGFRLKWKGDQVIAEAEKMAAAALSEIGLLAEAEAKKELYKGHGVLTGTLRRSIHTAPPGYNWSGDNAQMQTVKTARSNYRSASGFQGEKKPKIPEMGGQAAEPGKKGNRLVLEFGSGLVYAMAVHQGHGSFPGYHYLVNGLDKVIPRVPGILKKHATAFARRGAP